jgi:hypothetical protein
MRAFALFFLWELLLLKIKQKYCKKLSKKVAIICENRL